MGNKDILMEDLNNQVYKWNYTSIMKELLALDDASSGGYTSKDIKENILTGGNVEEVTQANDLHDLVVDIPIEQEATQDVTQPPDDTFTGGDKDPVDVIKDILLNNSEELEEVKQDIEVTTESLNVTPEVNEPNEEVTQDNESTGTTHEVTLDALDNSIESWLANLKNTFQNTESNMRFDDDDDLIAERTNMSGGGEQPGTTHEVSLLRLSNRFPYVV